MVKAFMANGFSLELCEGDTVWIGRRFIAEKLDEAVSRINIIRNNSPLWNNFELLGKDDVSIIISDERVERELIQAIGVSDFNRLLWWSSLTNFVLHAYSASVQYSKTSVVVFSRNITLPIEETTRRGR